MAELHGRGEYPAGPIQHDTYPQIPILRLEVLQRLAGHIRRVLARVSQE